jgi:hypothetical protein
MNLVAELLAPEVLHPTVEPSDQSSPCRLVDPFVDVHNLDVASCQQVLEIRERVGSIDRTDETIRSIPNITAVPRYLFKRIEIILANGKRIFPATDRELESVLLRHSTMVAPWHEEQK